MLIEGEISTFLFILNSLTNWHSLSAGFPSPPKAAVLNEARPPNEAGLLKGSANQNRNKESVDESPINYSLFQYRMLTFYNEPAFN